MTIKREFLPICLALIFLVPRAPFLWGGTDAWVSHVASQGGWKTSVAVYYSGAEPSASFTLDRIDESGNALGDPAALTAANNAWSVLPESLLAYDGSARLRAESSLLVKVGYRYAVSLSLCEFYVAGDTGQEWILPVSALPWFEWTGIALVNSSDARATVTLEAWKLGAVVATRSIALEARSKFAQTSDVLWSGLTPAKFDTAVIRASVPIPAPISITGNSAQDRHVFFTAQPRPQNGQSLYLTNGTLIDGTGRDPVSDAVVGIRNGRIIAIGRRGDVAVPGKAETLDVNGAFILPGFINAHVHNAFNLSNLRIWAQAGVTTVRDVGAYDPPAAAFRFRDSTRADSSCSRLVAAGPLVTVPGGYPIAGNNFPAMTVSSPEDARTKITSLADQGAELIKITLEGGPGWPVLKQEEVRAIVETAHGRSLPVTAHVTNSQFLRMALDAGVDDAAHSVTDFLPEEMLRQMLDSGMMLVPTLTALRKSGSTLSNLRRFAEAGGKVAMGNDGGYLAGLEIGMPITELEAMQEAGMSPMHIIVAATRNAAEACRLDRIVGTIEFDKNADILIVRGNPLENLRTLLEVDHVIHGGTIIR